MKRKCGIVIGIVWSLLLTLGGSALAQVYNQAGDDVVGVGARRHHDDAHIRLRGPDTLGQADPVLTRKPQIQNQQIGAKTGQFVIERFGAIRPTGIMAHGAQGFDSDLAQHVVVFNDDDIQPGIHR